MSRIAFNTLPSNFIQWNRKQPAWQITRLKREFLRPTAHHLQALIMSCSRWIQIRDDSGRHRLHRHLAVEGCVGRR